MESMAPNRVSRQRKGFTKSEAWLADFHIVESRGIEHGPAATAIGAPVDSLQILSPTAGASLVALGTALIGMLFGQLVRGEVRAETFRLCSFLGLLLPGAHLALRGML